MSFSFLFCLFLRLFFSFILVVGVYAIILFVSHSIFLSVWVCALGQSGGTWDRMETVDIDCDIVCVTKFGLSSCLLGMI